MSLNPDTESTSKEISLSVKFTALQKEHLELKVFNEVCIEALKRQGDWKKHYQELSRDHRELRRELERWQKRTCPTELSLRHNWVRPTVFLRNLEKGFTEHELGNFLWYQLELVEPGLRFCGEQVHCGNGFVDIVAEDRYNKHVLIELKVIEDDQRLWNQVVRYPKAYAETYDVKLDDVRMMVIAPSFGSFLRQELLKIGATIFKYANVSEGLIVTRI